MKLYILPIILCSVIVALAATETSSVSASSNSMTPSSNSPTQDVSSSQLPSATEDQKMDMSTNNPAMTNASGSTMPTEETKTDTNSH